MANRTVLRKRGRVTVDGNAIPVTVFFERRTNARVSAGKDSVLLRVPAKCTGKQLTEYKQWCSRWVRKQWETSPRFRAVYTYFDIKRCRRIYTADKEFTIKPVRSDRKTAKGSIEGTVIQLELPHEWEDATRSDVAYRMIHDLLARVYMPSFERRVRAMHGGRFSKRIRSIALRNMSSRWGSCSEYGELSFSTRLLFAPRSVQDYVILHELCHLEVMDHSDRYWRRVASHDPHYEKKERWLDEQGHLCDVKHNHQRAKLTGARA
jgi:predicted metal-dependent hydrolase